MRVSSLLLEQLLRRLDQAFDGRFANFAVVFAHAEFVKFQMFEFHNADEAQAVRAAFERAAVDHHELRRFLHRARDGFNVSADPGEAAHFRDAKLVQPAGGVVRQFAGM